MPKELNYFSSYDVMLKYICAKKIYITSYLKNANIFKNWFKWILIFMKFLVFIKHFDSI
jgi:hypothetical protein